MLFALIALALNLRSPLTAISPVLSLIRADLGISPAIASLLTSIPVLCFGLMTPLASSLIARTGIEASIFVALGGVMLGTLVRPADGVLAALAGTVIIGAALTIGNIVSLMVIARDYPRRTAVVTGIYTSALNVGSMLTSALTPPLATLFGWRPALAAWVGLAFLAVVLWILALRRRTAPAPPATAAPMRPMRSPEASGAAPARRAVSAVWRRPLAWMLVGAFTAHIFIYYGLTAWLPTYLMQADGMDATGAGFAASAFQILALLGSFGVPALAAGGRIPAATLLIGIAVAWFVTPVGFLLAPAQWVLWSIFGGIASGGGFTVIFMLVMDHAGDLSDNRRMSALVQGMGYALASAGPFVVGVLQQASGGWALGFLPLAAVALAMALAGVGVTRSGNDRGGPSQ